MVLAFYAVYLMVLVCLYAGLSYAFGLTIALVLLGVIPVSCLLLLVLCSAPSDREREQQPREGARYFLEVCHYR
jgi:hypothetical protein